jgi:prepilin-type N-terminal cleavage/methylation domain-containing protein
MHMRRTGHTLVELLVALAVGALVLGLGATIGFRHQRFHRDVVIAVERAETIDQLVALMPISLRGIAPGEGDVAPSGARDTSLEFRAAIMGATLCDSGTAVVVAAPGDAPNRLASVLSRPESGDTAWFLDTSPALETWAPRVVTAAFDTSAVCRLGGSLPFGSAPRTSVALRLSSPAPAGSAVVRVTRPWRYSLYRASDGGWYLGAKEWNPGSGKFNTIQPVAGPLVSASAGGMKFRYLDSLGASLPAVPPDPRRIAAVEVAFRVDSTMPGTYVHATAIRGRASVVVALRNRAR